MAFTRGLFLMRCHQPLDSVPLAIEILVDAAAAARAAARRIHTAARAAIAELDRNGKAREAQLHPVVFHENGLDAAAITRPVVATRGHRGHRRITLTVPTLNAARTIVWLVLGRSKQPALRRLRRGDRSIPASLIAREHATAFRDGAAAGAPSSGR